MTHPGGLSSLLRAVGAAFGLLLSLALLAGCGVGGPGQAARPSAEPQQGLRVKVVKLVGDFTMEPVTGRRLPECVPVHVFRGRVQPFEKPDAAHPALLQVVVPGADGRFALPLPPGEYTLVLELDGRLYLNNWLADGCWAIAEVEARRWTDYSIENVLEAIF